MKYYRYTYAILTGERKSSRAISIFEAWQKIREHNVAELEITCNRLVDTRNNLYMLGIKKGNYKLMALFFDDLKVGESFLDVLKNEIEYWRSKKEPEQQEAEFSRTIFVDGQPVGVITDSDFYYKLKYMQVIDYADY